LEDVYDRIRVPLPDLSLFEAAFEILHPKDMMHILLAKLDGVDIAALTLLLYKGTLLYWYTGPLRRYSEFRAGDLLVWRALEFGKEHGCDMFDFGGGGRPDQEYGVRDFRSISDAMSAFTPL
jgi:lipid II:glycine glycyltransferase (peptidoglycan interpeptide bridge formation enzyme)